MAIVLYDAASSFLPSISSCVLLLFILLLFLLLLSFFLFASNSRCVFFSSLTQFLSALSSAFFLSAAFSYLSVICKTAFVIIH